MTNNKDNINYSRILELINIDTNSICADCNKNSSKWAHTLFGIFLCCECALNHKNVFLETHNRIKSLEESQWDADSILIMNYGGNFRFNSFLNEYGITTNTNDIKRKYLYKATLYYIRYLHAIAAGNIYEDPKPLMSEGLHCVSLKEIESSKSLIERFKDKLKDTFNYKEKSEVKNEEKLDSEVKNINNC